jgi:hypothetical protein
MRDGRPGHGKATTHINPSHFARWTGSVGMTHANTVRPQECGCRPRPSGSTRREAEARRQDTESSPRLPGMTPTASTRLMKRDGSAQRVRLVRHARKYVGVGGRFLRRGQKHSPRRIVLQLAQGSTSVEPVVGNSGHAASQHGRSLRRG